MLHQSFSEIHLLELFSLSSPLRSKTNPSSINILHKSCSVGPDLLWYLIWMHSNAAVDYWSCWLIFCDIVFLFWVIICWEAGQTNFNILHKLLSWSRPTLVFKLESGMDAFKSCFLVIIIVRLIIWLFYSFLGVDILSRKGTKHNSNINIILKLPSWAQPALVLNQDVSGYWSFGKLHSVDLFLFGIDYFHLTGLSDPFWESKSNSKPSWVGRTKVVFFSISPSSTNFKIRFLTEDLV